MGVQLRLVARLLAPLVDAHTLLRLQATCHSFARVLDARDVPDNEWLRRADALGLPAGPFEQRRRWVVAAASVTVRRTVQAGRTCTDFRLACTLRRNIFGISYHEYPAPNAPFATLLLDTPTRCIYSRVLLGGTSNVVRVPHSALFMPNSDTLAEVERLLRRLYAPRRRPRTLPRDGLLARRAMRTAPKALLAKRTT